MLILIKSGNIDRPDGRLIQKGSNPQKQKNPRNML